MILSLISCDTTNKNKDTEKDIHSTENTQISEAERAMEMYEAAIKGEICVIDEHLGEIKLKACRFPSNNLRLDESNIDGKSVLDMNGDGINEYIIISSHFDSIMMYCYNDKVYVHAFTSSEFNNLKKDGSFYWNNSDNDSYNHGSANLSFDGIEIKYNIIYATIYDENKNAKYYLNEKEVTHDIYKDFLKEQSSDFADTLPFYAPWYNAISEEQAIKIASEYWYECYNIKAGDVDSETGFPYAFLPKNSNNENYRIALAWLVEGTHYSTLEMIEIDAFTGEIIVPTYEPDGKG